MKRPLLIGNRRGFTMMEAVIAGSIMVVVSVATVQMMSNMKQGFTMLETKGALKGGGQAGLNHLHQLLLNSMRIIDSAQNVGSSFTGTGLHFSPYNDAPAPTGGTVLPTIQINGSLSVGDPNFAGSSTGNSILFVVPGISSVTIPVTVISAPTVVIGTIRFHYFYQAQTGTKLNVTLPDGSLMTQVLLYDWQSQDIPNYNDIKALGRADLIAEVATYLSANPPGPYVWDSTAKLYSDSFHICTTADCETPATGISIPFDKVETYPHMPSGVSSSMRAGVAPNAINYTSGLKVPALYPPVDSTDTADFPGGFEVAIVGPAGTRSVYARLVTLGSGAFPKPVADEEVVITSVRDTW